PNPHSSPTRRSSDLGTIVVSEDGLPLTDSDGYIGSTNPKAMVGWGNVLSYNNLSLRIGIDGRFGGDVISTTQGYLDSFGYSKRRDRKSTRLNSSHVK